MEFLIKNLCKINDLQCNYLAKTLLIFYFIFGLIKAEGNELPFLSILESSVKSSPFLKAQNDTVSVNKYNLRSSRGLYFPQIQIGGEGGVERQRFLSERNYYGPNATVTWSLFDMNRNSLVELRKKQFAAARVNYDASLTDYLFEVSTVLSSYLESIELERINKRNIRSLTKQMVTSKGKYRGGDLPKTPWLRVQGQLLASETQLERTMQLQNFLHQRFLSLTGMEPPKKLQLPAFKSYFESSKEFSLEDLAQSSPNLKRLRKQVEVAEKQVKVFKAQRWPVLAVQGSYQYEEIYDTDRFRDNYESTALLTLSMPLFTGGRITNDIKSSIAQRNSAKALLRQEK